MNIKGCFESRLIFGVIFILLWTKPNFKCLINKVGIGWIEGIKNSSR
jgi:hypothetical protein